MISCGRMVRRDGRPGWVPLKVDGLIYASSMVMLDCAQAGASLEHPAAISEVRSAP